jgi:predicted HicB family RNase H-like nuclease
VSIAPRKNKREAVAVMLRMPPDLHKLLVYAAEDRRPSASLNREIITRLYASFDRDIDVMGNPA